MKRGKENMVHDLKALSDKVSWKCADKEINLKITDAFFVSEDKETGLIKIDSGKEFIVEKVYYYTLYGICDVKCMFICLAVYNLPACPS